jgi:uncharacterized protein YdaU (DUF1376 family)
MAKSKVMPFYVADYLVDTTRLTTEQHGAYLLPILDYWQNGPLPDDDAVLCNVTRLPPTKWQLYRKALAKFFRVTNGEWRHQRIDTEREKTTENEKKISERAHKGAAARWSKQPEGNASSTPAGIAKPDTTRMLSDMQGQCQPPSSSSEDKFSSELLPLSERDGPGERSIKETRRRTENPAYTPEFREFWAVYARQDGRRLQAATTFFTLAAMGISHETMTEGARQYARYVAEHAIEIAKVAQASTWLMQQKWKSEYLVKGTLANEIKGTRKGLGNTSLGQSRRVIPALPAGDRQ